MRNAITASIVIAAAAMGGTLARADTITVDQKDRAFAQDHLDLHAGDTVRFTNNDDFDHQVYAQSPAFSFDTDETEPGQHTDVRFTRPGHYQVLCHIHPKMRMDVDVK